MPDLKRTLVVRVGNSFRLDLSISIPPGTTAALLGPNGSGKSTAVAALAGLLPLEEGRITAGRVRPRRPGHRICLSLPRHGRVGVVFQDYLLFPHLNVIENIAFGLRSRRVGKDVSLARSARMDRTTGPRRARSIGVRGISRVARPNVWPWLELWSPSRTCCCWMSRCPPSTSPPGSSSGEPWPSI